MRIVIIIGLWHILYLCLRGQKWGHDCMVQSVLAKNGISCRNGIKTTNIHTIKKYSFLYQTYNSQRSFIQCRQVKCMSYLEPG